MATARKTPKLGPTAKALPDAGAVGVLEARDYVFHGRTLRVQMLSEGQIVVVKRLADRLQGVQDNTDVTAEQIFKWLDRSVEIAMQVLVDQDDQEWLEGEILAKRVELVETLKLCADVIQEYANETQAVAKKEAKKTAGRRVKST